MLDQEPLCNGPGETGGATCGRLLAASGAAAGSCDNQPGCRVCGWKRRRLHVEGWAAAASAAAAADSAPSAADEDDDDGSDEEEEYPDHPEDSNVPDGLEPAANDTRYNHVRFRVRELMYAAKRFEQGRTGQNSFWEVWNIFGKNDLLPLDFDADDFAPDSAAHGRP